MFVPHFDFRPHALIQHGIISIWKNGQRSRRKKTSLFLFGQHGPESVRPTERRIITPSPAWVPSSNLRVNRKPGSITAATTYEERQCSVFVALSIVLIAC